VLSAVAGEPLENVHHLCAGVAVDAIISLFCYDENRK